MEQLPTAILCVVGHYLHTSIAAWYVGLTWICENFRSKNNRKFRNLIDLMACDVQGQFFPAFLMVCPALSHCFPTMGKALLCCWTSWCWFTWSKGLSTAHTHAAKSWRNNILLSHQQDQGWLFIFFKWCDQIRVGLSHWGIPLWENKGWSGVF